MVQKDGKLTRNSCTRHFKQCLHEALPLKITGEISFLEQAKFCPVRPNLCQNNVQEKGLILRGDCQWLLACEQTCWDYT
jgi:hypothetical protein